MTRAWLFALGLAPVLALPAACSSSSSGATGQLGGDASIVDAGANDASTYDACTFETVPLDVALGAGGVPTRLHVPVTYLDGGAYMLLDMGSDSTFLDAPLGSPDPVYDAGTIELGCRTETLYARPVVPEDPLHGVPCVGTVGTDLLLNGISKIDFGAKQVVLHPPGNPFDDATGWPAAPYDDVQGLVLAHVTIDGTPVRLEVDTGSQDTLLVGAQPQPGDQEVDTTDALGNPLKLYEGTAVLEIGGTTKTVPILRAPSFPYFEQGVKDLGGNIQGLYGLSSMGKALVVDTDAMQIRVGF